MKNLITNINQSIKRSFDFKSKTNSMDIIRWFAFLITVSIALIGLMFFQFQIINKTDLNSLGIFSKFFVITLTALFVFWAASFIPTMSLCIRRLKTIGLSPFLVFIPILSLFVIVRYSLMMGFASMNAEPLPISVSNLVLLHITALFLIVTFLAVIVLYKTE